LLSTSRIHNVSREDEFRSKSFKTAARGDDFVFVKKSWTVPRTLPMDDANERHDNIEMVSDRRDWFATHDRRGDRGFARKDANFLPTLSTLAVASSTP
jgi:hypothetical protein